ncbi:MAG: hypothetical protein V4792_01875 [Pseudomonadota bacterium]
MRKTPSFWPAQRRLFRDRNRRSLLVTLVIWALSVAAAILLVSVLRQPVV